MNVRHFAREKNGSQIIYKSISFDAIERYYMDMHWM